MSADTWCGTRPICPKVDWASPTCVTPSDDTHVALAFTVSRPIVTSERDSVSFDTCNLLRIDALSSSATKPAFSTPTSALPLATVRSRVNEFAGMKHETAVCPCCPVISRVALLRASNAASARVVANLRDDEVGKLDAVLFAARQGEGGPMVRVWMSMPTSIDDVAATR